MITIKDFQCGQELVLKSYGETDVHYRQLILSLGLTIGVKIKVIRKAPLGCPIQIEVRGTTLALRKNEAQYLQWELL